MFGVCPVVHVPLFRKGITWYTDKNVKFRNPQLENKTLTLAQVFQGVSHNTPTQCVHSMFSVTTHPQCVHSMFSVTIHPHSVFTACSVSQRTHTVCSASQYTHTVCSWPSLLLNRHFYRCSLLPFQMLYDCCQKLFQIMPQCCLAVVKTLSGL